MDTLLHRYGEKINGVIEGFDRIVFKGTLRPTCLAANAYAEPEPLRRLDSSTGPGQITAKTAIAANNWGVKNSIIKGKTFDMNEPLDMYDMWKHLKYFNEFNINMIGLILLYEANNLGYPDGSLWIPEQEILIIGKYNGNVAYGQLLHKYVDVFDRYND